LSLSHIFELAEVQVRGNEYGWVNTRIDCLPGMPLEIQASGSIDFANAPFVGDEFTPDGDPGGGTARADSLGHGVHGIRHGQLIARIGNGPVFPVGSFKQFRSKDRGPLFLAHNDTKWVADNNGAFLVRVCMPVQAIRRRPVNVGGGRGIELTFEMPWGISGSASVSLPRWMTNHNPQVTIHDAPAHPSDPARGVFCTALPQVDLAFWKIHKCVHIQAG
jgi:hypothetical protein